MSSIAKINDLDNKVATLKKKIQEVQDLADEIGHDVALELERLTNELPF